MGNLESRRTSGKGSNSSQNEGDTGEAQNGEMEREAKIQMEKWGIGCGWMRTRVK
jgi:hypothetical protein